MIEWHIWIDNWFQALQFAGDDGFATIQTKRHDQFYKIFT